MKDSKAPRIEPSIELPIPVATALTRFGSSLRKWMVLESVGWLVAYFLLGLSLLATADRFLRLPHSWRLTVATIIYVGGSALIGVLLFRAFRRRSALKLAQSFEARAALQSNLKLEERISTTVELAAGGTATTGFAAGMIQRVADEAAHQIAKINVTQLVDRSGAQKAFSISLLLLFVASTLCLLPRWDMPTFYLRVAFPWMNLERPGRTRVRAQTGSTTVVEGQVLLIEALTQGDLVETAQVETRQKGSAWTPLAMDQDPNDETRFTLSLGPLHESLEYRISAGDGISKIYLVPVLPRPEVTGLTITVHYPDYTGLATQTYQRLSGDLALLEGSEVEITATSNTPLTAAVLSFGDDRQLSMTAVGHQAHVSFEVTRDMRYRIRLRSNNGVSNPDAPLYFIQALSDRTPHITIIHPNADEQADAQAILPLEVRAEDDLSIVGMQLVIRTGFQSETSVIPLERPLDSGVSGKVWLITQPWDLAGLFLAEGESLSFHIEAFDAAGATGKSDERRIRIVSGRPQATNHAGPYLLEAHRRFAAANQLLQTTRNDVARMRQVFRMEDPFFQAADRTLFKDALSSAKRELHIAAQALNQAAPLVYSEGERSLCTGLQAALYAFLRNDAHLIEAAAEQSCSTTPTEIPTGLGLLMRRLSQAKQTTQSIQTATAAAFRYARAQEIATRQREIQEELERISPILIGASGWTPAGVFMPGLLLEQFQTASFKNPASRSVVAGFQKLNVPHQIARYSVGYASWHGEILAPLEGIYFFEGATKSDLTFTINKTVVLQYKRKKNKKRLKSLPLIITEGSIKLTQGWHPISVQFRYPKDSPQLRIRRSGPDGVLQRIPKSHFRTSGPPSAPHTQPNIRLAMTQAASKSVIRNALVRMRTLLHATQALPKMGYDVANVSPLSNTTAINDAHIWQEETDVYTSGMELFDSVTPALALPLLSWLSHNKHWISRYALSIKRFKIQMQTWEKYYSSYRNPITTQIHHISLKAQEASASIKRSSQISKKFNVQPPIEELKREQEVLTHSLRDLNQLTHTLSNDLEQASKDPKRPLAQRHILGSIQKQVQTLLRNPAQDAATQTENAALPRETSPRITLAHALAKLEQNADNLASVTEKNERSWVLEEALENSKETVFKVIQAIQSHPLPTRRNAILQANADLKRKNMTLERAILDAKGYISDHLWREASTVKNHLKSSHDQNRALTLSSVAQPPMQRKIPAPKPDPETPFQHALEHLNESQSMLTAVQQNINKQSILQARMAVGDYQTALKRAAQHATELVTALKRIKLKFSGSEMENALNTLAQTFQETQRALAGVTLAAQSLQLAHRTAKQQHQAQELNRIAAILKREHDQQLIPLRTVLVEMETDPGRSILFFPEVLETAVSVAHTLAFLAEQSLHSTPSNPDKSATELQQFLAQQKDGQDIEAALQAATLLSDASAEINANAATNVTANATPPAAPNPPDQVPFLNSEQIEAALALNNPNETQQPQQYNYALTAELAALENEVSSQSKQVLEAEELVNKANVNATLVRQKLTTESPRLVRTLSDLRRKAAILMDTEKSRTLKTSLMSAQLQLPTTSRAISELSREATFKNAIELAQTLSKSARSLRMPLSNLTSALRKSSGERKTKLLKLGAELRNVAGQLTDMSEAFSRSGRATETSNHALKQMEVREKKLIARTTKMLQLLSEPSATKNNSTQQSVQREALQKALQSNSSNSLHSDSSASKSRSIRTGQMAKAMQQLTGVRKKFGNKDDQNRSNAAPLFPEAIQSLLTKAQRHLAQARIAAQTGAHQRAQYLAFKAANQFKETSNRIQAHLTNPVSPKKHNTQRTEQEAQLHTKNPLPRTIDTAHSQSLIKRPKHAIVDQKTWNRLPDSLKKDLLNSASDRFPSEYEASIRRYFKSIAQLHDPQRKGAPQK